MVSLERINSCIRESLKERIWVSAFVSEFIGASAILWCQPAGCIHHMPVLKFRMTMT